MSLLSAMKRKGKEAPMGFEETGKKTPRHTVEFELNRVSTPAILWHLVKRHKFGLVVGWAVFMTIMYIFPAFPSFVASFL